MKHATETALRTIDSLLSGLRRYPALKERKLGIFYRKSAAFLHFHEDPKGIFAHLRTTDGWRRMPVNTATETRSFLRQVRKAMGE